MKKEKALKSVEYKKTFKARKLDEAEKWLKQRRKQKVTKQIITMTTIKQIVNRWNRLYVARIKVKEWELLKIFV